VFCDKARQQGTTVLNRGRRHEEPIDPDRSGRSRLRVSWSLLFAPSPYQKHTSGGSRPFEKSQKILKISRATAILQVAPSLLLLMPKAYGLIKSFQRAKPFGGISKGEAL
jgi:hypothetical protein